MWQQRGDQFGKFEEQGWIQVPIPMVASARCTLEAVTMKVTGVTEEINMPAPSAITLGWSWLQSTRALEVVGCLVELEDAGLGDDEKYCTST